MDLRVTGASFKETGRMGEGELEKKGERFVFSLAVSNAYLTFFFYLEEDLLFVFSNHQEN